jgi:hypothetical protein
VNRIPSAFPFIRLFLPLSSTDLRISKCIEFILPSPPGKFNFNFDGKTAQTRGFD